MLLILSLSLLVHHSQLTVILIISTSINFARVGLVFHVSSMFIDQSLRLILLRVPQLFLLAYAVSSHLLIGVTLALIFQNINNVNIVLRLLTSFIWVVILAASLIRSHLLVLNSINVRILAGVLFRRCSQIILRILLRVGILLYNFAFLILKSGDLLLGALHKLINLTLSLVLDGVISPLHLDIRWVNWILTTASSLFGTLIGNLNSGLWSTRAWTWCSYFMIFSLFDIFTLDHLIFYIILLRISVDYVDSKSVKLIDRIILVASSLYVVRLSSFLHLVRANKLIAWLLFLVRVVLIVFEALLRFLLLRMILFVWTICIFAILVLLIFLESSLSCSILLAINTVLLVLDLYFIVKLFQLILVRHIVSLI